MSKEWTAPRYTCLGCAAEFNGCSCQACRGFEGPGPDPKTVNVCPECWAPLVADGLGFRAAMEADTAEWSICLVAVVLQMKLLRISAVARREGKRFQEIAPEPELLSRRGPDRPLGRPPGGQPVNLFRGPDGRSVGRMGLN